MKKILSLIILALFFTGTTAQRLTVQEYINTYKDIAIREMKRTGVPASITIAQGILETESGNSSLVLRSNNHFGIKCKLDWTGGTVYHDDDETGECFRKYESAEESFRDHSDFLRNRERYAFLFTLDVNDYKGWARGLKKAGYATNPKYPQMLINSIEKYNLQQYTLQGLQQEDIFADGKIVTDKKEQQINIVPVKLEESVTPVEAGKNKIEIINGLKATYAVKGTSLLAIATKHDIPLSKLLEYNDLKTDGLLSEDKWILLEKKGKHDKDIFSAKKKTEQQEPVVKQTIHYVSPKEGLYAISKKYDVSVNDIRGWNNLRSDDLQVGQKLIILK